MAKTITAYCMKTKKKNVPMLYAKINKDGNRYMAMGEDKDGNKMSSILSESDAKMYLKEGTAKKGKGF